MIIGIDGNEANIEKKVGIGQYAYQVLTHLYGIRDAQRASKSGLRLEFTPRIHSEELRPRRIRNNLLDFRIYLKDQPRSDLPRENLWWKYKVFGPKRFWTQIALPYHLFIDKEHLSVFFTPSHYAPRFSPCPSVVSIMDLSFIYYPEMFLKKDLHQLRLWTAYSVKKSVKIFTISEFSKKEIIRHYKLSSDKVIVTYPGYDEIRFKIPALPAGRPNPKSQIQIKNIKSKYNIARDYILFVGTLQPRKNIIRLIEAFDMIMKQCNNETTQLVLVGKKGWLYDDIFTLTKKLHLEKRLIFVDFVTDHDLAHLYHGAKCFVLPSLYEGFGIPAVEAMACGCPVVVSNVSSLPEVVGDAGILVDPQNIRDIAEGIYNAGFNELERKKFIKKGLTRVKLFSWKKCAEKTLEILERVRT